MEATITSLRAQLEATTHNNNEATTNNDDEETLTTLTVQLQTARKEIDQLNNEWVVCLV